MLIKACGCAGKIKLRGLYFDRYHLLRRYIDINVSIARSVLGLVGFTVVMETVVD